MNGFATVFLLLNAGALLFLPRRWAPLPLFMGTCYMTGFQGIDLGVFFFSVLRLLLLFGVLRVLVRNERPAGGLNGLDGLMIAWAFWVILARAFHTGNEDTLVFRLGLVYDTLGVYFLVRCFCRSAGDALGLAKIISILLVPVALEMLSEQMSGRNLFSLLGGVAETPALRNGRLRAQGPFAHAILAGTVGAVSLPLIVGLWRSHSRSAKVGIAACVLMIFTSASSGPIMSLLAAGFALVMWRYRHVTRQLRIAAVVGYILLDLVMQAPAYYLIARIDLAGGSTGFHRAKLIESAFEHLDEWWFAGTDYTRHWMMTGVQWSENHTDITNHYLKMGVLGGIPLMVLFIAIFWCAFRYVGQLVRLEKPDASDRRFTVWCFGASLFSAAVTCVSVPFFGQSFIFLYACLAVIGSLRGSVAEDEEAFVSGDWSDSSARLA